MKALDLFCGAGGATRGLQMAGFEVWISEDMVKQRFEKFYAAKDYRIAKVRTSEVTK